MRARVVRAPAGAIRSAHTGTVLLADAYTGPPELTLLRLFTAWTFDVPTVLLVVLLGGGYGWALVRLRAARAPWPRNRVLAFAAGVVLVGLLGFSFLGVYSPVLFWVRAAQNMLSLMVVPLLLALGAPLRLTLDAAPAGVASTLRRVGHSAVLRILTFPLVMTVFLVGPLLVLYLTPLYEQTLRHGLLSFAARTGLTACGFLYFWTRMQLDPTPRGGSHVVSFAISITEAIADGVLGIVLWLGPAVAPAYYAAVARPWGPSPYLDQVFGAGVLWIGGDVAGIPFLLALFFRWMRDDERTARQVDDELDREELAARLRVPVVVGQDGDGDGSAPAAGSGLWWETDENLADRFRRG